MVVDLCPESTPAAEAAVIAYRQTLAPAKEGPSAPGVLTFEEHMVAINARLAPLFELGNRFVQVGRAISQCLWPEWATDVSLAVICNWLGTAPDRIREWRRSAARAGSKKALEFVTSWYTAERDSNEPANPVFQQQLHDRACIISSYAETDDFIPSVEGEFVEADEPVDSEAEYLSEIGRASCRERVLRLV